MIILPPFHRWAVFEDPRARTLKEMIFIHFDSLFIDTWIGEE
jgi:hypothetical protein